MNAGEAGSVLGERLNFLHLSDIHFSQADDEQKWDLNLPIRNALLEDVSAVVDEAGGVSAVLITGDVAFSGRTDEYEIASEWIDRLCERVDLPDEDVWVVPGNHDVDRAIVRQSVATLHRRLRECPLKALDVEFEGILKDQLNGSSPLVTPLAAYNVFASRYDCAVTGQDPYWQKEFDLDPGYRIKLRGLTTVFVSDDLDDDAANKLVLGSVQTRPEVLPGDILVTLGHHPVGWLRDGDTATSALDGAATIQLWGHRHVHGSANVDGCLQIFAGALQPYRTEPPWEPRYNMLSLQLHHTAADPLLRTEIRSRIWSSAANRFVSDLGGRFGYPRIDDLPVRTVRSPQLAGQERPVTAEEEAYPADVRQGAPLMIHNRVRRLGFRFANLPFDVRLQIVMSLGLVTEEEGLLPDQELFRTAFARASEGQQLAALWAAVDARYDQPIEANPFE